MAADFAGQPDHMREAINYWVSERTNNLIPELFPDGSIDGGTLMVLVNALYLKAPWLMPFGSPRPGGFTTATGAQIQVPMMTTRVSGTEALGGGWAAATVPYAGYYLQMTLLVPVLGNFDALLAGLDADLMVTASGGTRDCGLTMPRFNVSSTPDVQQAIMDSGVVDLFGPSADLSGIAGDPGDLLATTLVHQAIIKSTSTAPRRPPPSAWRWPAAAPRSNRRSSCGPTVRSSPGSPKAPPAHRFSSVR